MKLSALMLTTAVAGMMQLAPASVADANAAGIKVKPQIVKVRPKIAVAKPKVRVKVRAAKVRVKPKVKIRAARIKPKIRTATIKPRLRVKPRTRKATAVPRLKPKLAVRTVPLSGPMPKAAVNAAARIATIKPDRVKAPAARPVPKTSTRSARINSHARIKDIMQAAQGVEAARDAITMGAMRTAATVKPGLGAISLTPATRPSNRDVLGGMFKTPDGGKMPGKANGDLWGNRDLGRFGPGSFGGLANSHAPGALDTGTAAGAAKDYLNINRGIASGMAGIAGRQPAESGEYRSPPANGPGRSGSMEYGHYTTERNGDAKVYVTYWRDPDGQYHSVERYVDSNQDTTSRTVTTPRWSTTRQEDGTYVTARNRDAGRTHESGPTGGSEDQVHRQHTPAPAELRDPDSGYSGPSPFPWLDEKQTFEFSSTTPGTPGPLTQGPEHNTNQQQQVQASVSQNDVLERYDEDTRNRGKPTPIDRQRVQSD